LWERMYDKPLASWLEQQWVLRTSQPKAQDLRDAHLTVIDQACALAQRRHDDIALRQLRDDILMAWIEALPARVDTTPWDSVQARRRLVNRACELMLAHTEAPLSILNVCSQLGISRRKLNYCFADVLGTSPMQYLRAMRLNGVHRDLQQAAAGTTVQDVAAHWGFWHLSQFAQDYKKRFGQLPSQTLRKTE
jgi:AraC family ethanolamine operon transcriptional activator